MRRKILICACAFNLLIGVVDTDTAVAAATGGATATGGLTATVRRRDVGDLVQGVNYLSYVPMLMILAIIIGIIWWPLPRRAIEYPSPPALRLVTRKMRMF